MTPDEIEEKRINRIVRQAQTYKHCSDGYIESKLWEGREQDTSMNGIKNAIAVMRGMDEEKQAKQLA